MTDGPESVLLTDLYQLTMLHTYFDQGMEETAVFEFFVRKLPRQRAFLLAAGLEQALEYLENLKFLPDELSWLAGTGRFHAPFLDYLEQFRFTGDVHAMQEGTVFFANEPILRVTAPLAQAQLVESRLVNILHFQTLIASKAVRSVLAARGKLLVDFGMRRAHGAEAGLLAARASYLAGFSGTATVLAGMRYGLPIFGTMAHSLVQAHDSESEAFLHFARSQPDNVVLLIDTYDIQEGARKVVDLAPRLAAEGITVKSVRLDSGDLGEGARQVRAILDAGGQRGIGIFCSGSLDEYLVDTLLAAGAPIDGFGIGTHLDTSADAPYLDCAYKLEEYAGRARRKCSAGKATWPGRKQVYRHYAADQTMDHDVLALETEPAAGEPLIRLVMQGGKRLYPPAPAAELRRYAAAQVARLPPGLRRIEGAPPYTVQVSYPLQALAEEVDRHIR
jgi:nicotinate phosphoribosyltransferase